MIDKALEVFSSGPYHKPEVARSCFKKSQILEKGGRPKEAKDALLSAVQLRNEIAPKAAKPAEELADEDFDSMPIFWSR